MLMLKEFARCYHTGIYRENFYMFANAELVDNEWCVELRPRDGEQGRYYTEKGHDNGNGKCCMASNLSATGCPSCGSSRLQTGCRAPDNSLCRQQHKKMIWCKRCLVTPFCSIECKVNSAAAHKAVCERMSKDLHRIGLGNVCFACGVPAGTDGVRLQQCARCQAAWYCSKTCQRDDWKKGHKLDCHAPQDGEVPIASIRTTLAAADCGVRLSLRRAFCCAPRANPYRGPRC